MARPRYVPIDEAHPFQGQSPYSATKIGADRLAESYHRSFGLPVVIVRPFNTYGPRQSARAVIPTVITQLLAGVPEIKMGALEPTRDFNYVKDTANGFVEIAKSDKTVGEEINIATGVEISVGQLAGELISQINPESAKSCAKPHVSVPKNRRWSACWAANQKLMSLTGWKYGINLPFTKGLAETIAWFRVPENLARYKTGIYNI